MKQKPPTTRPSPQPEPEPGTFPTKEIIGTHFTTRLPIAPKFTSLHAGHVDNTAYKQQNISFITYITSTTIVYALFIFCIICIWFLYRKLRKTKAFLLKGISILNTFSARPIVRNPSVRSTESYLLAFNSDYDEVTSM